jgi:hypothetical protein
LKDYDKEWEEFYCVYIWIEIMLFSIIDIDEKEKKAKLTLLWYSQRDDCHWRNVGERLDRQWRQAYNAKKINKRKKKSRFSFSIFFSRPFDIQNR